MSEQETTIVEEIQDQTTESTEQQESTETQEAPIDIEAIRLQATREASALFMGALGEKERRIAELESRSVSAPVVEEVDDGASFLQGNPKKMIAEIVKNELSAQLGPVIQSWESSQRGTVLGNIKQQFAASPHFKGIIDNYGDVVDHLIGNGPVTPQSVQAAILMVPGLIQTGQVAERKTVVQKLEDKGTNIPGNLKPSPPAPPRRNEDKTISITDQEKQIARRLGKTDAEYVALRDAPPSIDSWNTKESK